MFLLVSPTTPQLRGVQNPSKLDPRLEAAFGQRRDLFNELMDSNALLHHSPYMFGPLPVISTITKPHL